MKKINSRFNVSCLAVMTCVEASLSAEEKSADAIAIAMELGNPASCLTSLGNNIEYRT